MKGQLLKLNLILIKKMIMYEDCSTRELVYLIGNNKKEGLDNLSENDLEMRTKSLIELQARYGPMAYSRLMRIVQVYLTKNNI